MIDPQNMKPKSNFTLPEKRDYAARMRSKPTLAEESLWFHLCNSKLGYRFVRQNLCWGYILDFYCAKLRLGIEVDGSVHQIEDTGADDEHRERNLNARGIEIIRYSNEDVLSTTSRVVSQIRAEMLAREQALKALSRKFSGTIDISSSSRRGKNSVENRQNAQTGKPVQRVSESEDCANKGRTPATDEDIQAVNEAWRNLLAISTVRSVELTGAELSSAAERAYEQKYGLTEWLKKRNESASLTMKGMNVTNGIPRKA